MTIKGLLLGLLVDEVREVIAIEESAVSKNVQSEIVIDTKYIFGTFTHENSLVIWVDIEKLLTAKELADLEEGLERV